MTETNRTSYWKRKKSGYTQYGNICFIAVMLFAALSIYGCNSKHNEANHNEAPKPQQDYVSEPTPIYQEPYYPTQTHTAPETTTIPQEHVQKSEPTQIQSQPQPTQETTISRYYEEGYEKGYDDGEDDAVMDNGWGGQFDDSCPYKGKKRKEFQLGYEEGYEAGYYDNKDGDE